MDFWFEADTIREVANMTSTEGDHGRTSVHPLLSLITFTPVYIVRHVFSLGRFESAVIVASIVGGIWAGGLYVLLRLIGCRMLDASLFTLLGLCSASSLFWLSIPNAYTWGSLTTMIALSLLLLAEQRSFGAMTYVVMSAFTFSFTVTDWMAGLLVTFAKWPWRRAFQLSVNAFCLVVVLWGVQKFVFPTAEFFLGSRKEAAYVGHAQMGGFHDVAQSFFFHSLVAPEIKFIDDDGYVLIGEDSFRLSQRLTFQFSPPGSAGPMGMVAVVSWGILMALGVWRLVSESRLVRFRFVLGLLIAFQLSLHLVYGEETFVHSLHYTPLLIGLASLGTFGPGRPFVLALGCVLFISGAVNNWQQFRQASDLSTLFTPQRDIVSRAMQKDPLRPWPRGTGHVVVGLPGAPEADRAYHEPGGDFSPQTPSFGVSFWLCDASGRPVVTSQTLPLHEIEQSFEPSGNPDVPDIVTKTPYYETRWSRLDSKQWQLRFRNHTSHVPVILIRSVGPAGGPITSLDWNGQRIQINGQWTASLIPMPFQVSLGEEQAAGWMTEQSPNTNWVGKSGWGYARVVLASDPVSTREEYRLVISNGRIPIDLGRSYKNLPASTIAHLPEPRFSASMEAQRAHLMMGLVGQETRPGDPMYYYRAWNRPGSYITAALARAGNPHTSRVLSQFLAMHDFVGGNGAEADEPGLILFALAEAAKYIVDPTHDAWLWPHVHRKAQRIESMLAAKEPMVESLFIPSPYGAHLGQQTTQSLLANPSQRGMIIGRVGDEWPLLYVNAVSYRGLVAAAELAERSGKHHYATQWRKKAEALQETWQRHFLTGPIDPEVYKVGLWPSAIAAPVLSTFARNLSALGGSVSGRGSIADALARAHQHLHLGHPDAVWRTIQEVWNRQASPGLYTWETPAPGPRHVADGWQYIRGWRKPSVTPDYETAAQLLLLQQDMLAYWDDTGPEPTLVIGAGIPSTWLSKPMSVAKLPFPGGSTNWQWDGQRMRVSLNGASPRIRLGSAFPTGAEISIMREG
jgi:hypothetical protein